MRDTILKAFPNVNWQPIQGGWQIKHHGMTFTIYPKKKKYNFKGDWGEFKTYPELIKIISHGLGLTEGEEVAEPKLPRWEPVIPAPHSEHDRVMMAIKHLKDKATRIEAGSHRCANALANILICTADELYQYLP